MLLPEPVNRVENDVALQAFYGGGLFVGRFALVSVLDLFDQELCVLIDAARFELRFLFSQAERECRVHPMDETGVIRFIDI